MAVVGIYALAKELSTSCPILVTTPNTVPVSCCQYDPTDCSIRYVGATYRLYYQQCNGNIGCTRQVSWISTTCNQTVHLASTNYMKMDYYCISGISKKNNSFKCLFVLFDLTNAKVKAKGIVSIIKKTSDRLRLRCFSI